MQPFCEYPPAELKDFWQYATMFPSREASGGELKSQVAQLVIVGSVGTNDDL
jgi:hypothetical protein